MLSSTKTTAQINSAKTMTQIHPVSLDTKNNDPNIIRAVFPQNTILKNKSRLLNNKKN